MITSLQRLLCIFKVSLRMYVILFLLLLLGFSPADLTAQNLYYGDSVSIGNGMIKTWVNLDSENKPLEIGVTLTAGALTGLPSAVVFNSLNLPLMAVDSLFRHVFINWNPQGHPPVGVYTGQHFDIHFYMISREEREQIPGGLDPVVVAPEFMPQDYMPIPGDEFFSIPQMGVHYVDSLAPELHGVPFTNTMIMGFYAGNMIFFEPMITKAFMETVSQEIMTIKQPASYQKSGYYAMTYTLSNNNGNVNVVLSDFVYHTGVSSVADLKTPSVFTLSQNYPNPFNPSTTINYTLSSKEYVTLKVTDILGKELEILVNELQEAGSYEINFNADNLSSGVYFYSLRGGTFNETRKMVLLR